MNATIRRRTIRWGAILVLLLVMLPNVAYLGHWSPFGQTTHAHSLHHERTDTDDHAEHCHGGPTSCGPQATVGSWWIGDDPNPIAPDAPTLDTRLEAPEAEPDPPASRILQPPRYA